MRQVTTTEITRDGARHARPIRVVTYAYANGRTADQYRSLATQTDVLRRHAQRNGWALVGEFADAASRNMSDRQGLTRVLSEARDGRYDVLLVYALDRLTRRACEGLQILSELERAGVLVLSMADTPAPAARRALEVQILAALAVYQRQVSLRERRCRDRMRRERCR